MRSWSFAAAGPVGAPDPRSVFRLLQSAFGFRQFPVAFYQLLPQTLVFADQTIMLTFQPLAPASRRVGLLR
jgi:hypothetical protein